MPSIGEINEQIDSMAIDGTLHDNIFQGTPVLELMDGRGQEVEGGETFYLDLEYNTMPVNVLPFGTRKIPTAVQRDVITRCYYTVGKFHTALEWSEDDWIKIKGSKQGAADWLNKRMNNVAKSLKNGISAHLWGGASNAGIYTFEDVFRQTGQFGNIDRGVETWWLANVNSNNYTTPGTATALSIDAMQDAYLEFVENAGKQPDLIVTDKAVLRYYYSLRDADTRYIDQLTMMSGGWKDDGLRFNGVPLTWDPKYPLVSTGNHSMTFFDFDTLFFVDITGYAPLTYPVVPPDRDSQTYTKNIYLYMQMASSALRNQTRLVDIDTTPA